MATANPDSATTSSSDLRSTSHRCGACDIEFPNLQEMRAHAKSELHVQTIRRRVAELDPIAHQIEKGYADLDFDTDTDTDTDAPSESDASVHSDSDPDQPPPTPTPTSVLQTFHPATCLFCRAALPDLAANLTHMAKAHGFAIPARNTSAWTRKPCSPTCASSSRATASA
ncbi:unnamed protein product [Parascedosporium putredinis]|uniref:C2H2-type domain-containing protein n=1 Tax=Parascedosporium putredinis TaxID=1442378 RepID=A0A9P1H2A7_9PEZI|nr:unnamed protein product [Parascedosporium putredinis]CAI7994751.1 unnamed protein product [Parascedosporium putredinis]